jgi:hypothetical protein
MAFNPDQKRQWRKKNAAKIKAYTAAWKALHPPTPEQLEAYRVRAAARRREKAGPPSPRVKELAKAKARARVLTPAQKEAKRKRDKIRQLRRVVTPAQREANRLRDAQRRENAEVKARVAARNATYKASHPPTLAQKEAKRPSGIGSTAAEIAPPLARYTSSPSDAYGPTREPRITLPVG